MRTLERMTHARTEKIRLDRLLVDRGLVESREKAQGLILAGSILVDEQKVEKCGTSGESACRFAPAGRSAQVCKPRRAETGGCA